MNLYITDAHNYANNYRRNREALTNIAIKKNTSGP